MKLKTEVSANKLRGGFYTPRPLVDFCLERAAELLRDRQTIRLLEPSAGDGAFLRGLDRSPALGGRISELVAIEPMELEAEKCRRSLEAARFSGKVIADSALTWAADSQETFDAAVGNPPFLRYQFVAESDRAAILRLSARLGVKFAGVSNLWIPVFLGTLGTLRPGGAFSFVVPTECLTGHAARTVRHWLMEHCDETSVDLFPPGSFPDVLQEIAVLSGIRASSAGTAAACVRIEEHHASGTSSSHVHRVNPEQHSWTHLLLTPNQRAALDEVTHLPMVHPLASVARFEVSIVTGANSFFTVSDDELSQYELAAWARPLLPRIRHAPGLRYTQEDHEAMRGSGARAWLLDFAEDRPDPLQAPKAAEYLGVGESQGLRARYKCRTREPWYRVPYVEKGSLLLSKRSHHFPRVVVNDAAAFTTDTIYRGDVHRAGVEPADLAAVFHNSLTLLTAELEGRSFGGGVLELVPSEISRLLVPVLGGAGERVSSLDRIARQNPAGLIRASDDLLVRSNVLSASQLEELRSAWSSLVKRRLERNAVARPHADSDDQLQIAA